MQNYFFESLSKKREYEGNCMRNLSKIIVSRRVFFFYPKTVVSPLIIALRYRFESEKRQRVRCSFTVSHLFCRYSTFIIFLLIDVFPISILRYFFLYYIFCLVNREGSSGSHVPYTCSSLTIVRSQLLATVHATAV